MVVVGAGIIGAACAYYLSKAGAAVTVIDKQGAATHASRASFAWLNATWAKQPKSYHHFSQLSLRLWKEVQTELNIPIRWQGSLEWFNSEKRHKKLVADIKEQIAWGEAAKIINTHETRTLEPFLLIPDDKQFAYSGNDGAVDPVLATNIFLSAAKAIGAKFMAPVRAEATVITEGRVTGISTSTGFLAADKVVLAIGANDSAFSRLGKMVIPQRSTPGVIAVTHPLPPIINSVVSAPGVHIHQREDGVIVLGEQSGSPKDQAHLLRLAGRPNDFPNPAVALAHGDHILKAATHYFPRLRKARISQAYIGWRPLPLDGHPVVGPSDSWPDVFAALAHSGITLAPLIGKLLSFEVVTGHSIPELETYRPSRKFESVVRY